MKRTVSVTVAWGICASLAAHSARAQTDTPLAKCEAHYAARAELSNVVKAYDCYAEAANAAKDVERRRALEGALLASVWVINKARAPKEADDTSELRALRRAWIDKSLPLAEALVTENAQTGSGFYWRAVFVSFDCGEAGFGPAGIACIVKRLGGVGSDLEQAFKLDPDYHGAGPERIQGYMHFEKSKWGQSSVNRAMEFVNKAVTRAPRCTLNAITLAEILLHDGQKERAKEVLERLVKLDPKDAAQVDPAFIQEALDDQANARAKLQKL